MAVFTHVSEKEVRTLLSNYDLGDYVRHEGIQAGVENTNYHLFTTTGRYILTLFEMRIQSSSLPFCFRFMEHLRKNGISCPNVVRDLQGSETRIVCDRHASILTFLEGKAVEEKDITPDHCRKVGAYLAAMHGAGEGFEAFRPNPVGMEEWNTLYCKVVPKADDVEDGLAEAMVDVLIDVREQHPGGKLPYGPVHADFFPDNVFFTDGDVSGVIDFYFSCTDVLIYDAAVTFNAWCGNADFTLSPEKAAAFWDGYESVRGLTPLERKYFPLMRKAAALRILLTRLHDWVFRPEDDVLIKAKDPAEYIAKLKWDVTDVL